MNIINGKEIQELKMKEFLTTIKNIDRKLKLVVIQVGNDAASTVYVNNKKIACEKTGILCEHIKYESIKENELILKIQELNADPKVTGILVQLPLPEYLNEQHIIDSIDPLKDIDGLTTSNIGNLYANKKGLVPCTAKGIIELLKQTRINIESADVVIVGRSKLVGLPLIKLLLNQNATVTVCHSKTKNLKEKTQKADILIVAIGKKNFIKEDYVKDGAVVIDVGITRENGKLYGDCDFENIKDKCSAITPVPKGVGPLTITMLIDNIIEAYKLQKK